MRRTPVTSSPPASGSDRRRSVRRAAGALLALLVSWPAAAVAHDGVGAAYKANVGRYLVYVYDGYVDEHGRVEYRTVILDAEDEQPVYDVQPTFEAVHGDGTDAPVEGFGNVFYFSLPNPYPERAQVRLELTGELGESATTFRVHGAAPEPAVLVDDGRPPEDGSALLWLGAGVTVVVLLVVAVLQLRRRR